MAASNGSRRAGRRVRFARKSRRRTAHVSNATSQRSESALLRRQRDARSAQRHSARERLCQSTRRTAWVLIGGAARAKPPLCSSAPHGHDGGGRGAAAGRRREGEPGARGRTKARRARPGGSSGWSGARPRRGSSQPPLGCAHALCCGRQPALASRVLWQSRRRRSGSVASPGAAAAGLAVVVCARAHPRHRLRAPRWKRA